MIAFFITKTIMSASGNDPPDWVGGGDLFGANGDEDIQGVRLTSSLNPYLLQDFMTSYSCIMSLWHLAGHPLDAR